MNSIKSKMALNRFYLTGKLWTCDVNGYGPLVKLIWGWQHFIHHFDGIRVGILREF